MRAITLKIPPKFILKIIQIAEKGLNKKKGNDMQDIFLPPPPQKKIRKKRNNNNNNKRCLKKIIKNRNNGRWYANPAV